ncbi:uncharacterized protein LOC120349311 [Nilaparvata lugens]|uniref:uncharacterized protein LOC120349311 n=1 Tax=Nilaparvata lugens TaxID=108931 RepID=UPI00193D5F16|nr:uncharacterized protein LOC120349311 [Nilaparvata lugens]
MTDADNSTDIDGTFTTPPDAEPWLVLCDRIPAHLIIDIIYDGKVNKFGRHSIIGVHVDYLEETWIFDLSNASQKNLFTLKSSVKFHVYKPKSDLPRFWELQMSPVYGATSLLNVFGIFSTDNYLYGNEKLLLSTMQLSLFVGFSILLYSLRRYL